MGSNHRLGRPPRFHVPFPLLIYMVAVLLRLVPALLSRDLGIGLDDMFQYDMLGRSLAAGDGFRWYSPPDLQRLLGALERYAGVDVSQVAIPVDPRGVETSFRAPIYPLFLASVYSLAGLASRFFVTRLVQAFIMASLAPMTYSLALHLGVKERHARVAAWIPTLWPLLIFFPLGLATENLFIPLLCAGTLALFGALDRGRDRDFILSGLIFALAALTRSVIIGFPILIALWLWKRRMRRQATLLAGTLVILVLPWSIRNSLLHHRPTFLETSLGYNLYLGYHPDGDGSFIFGPSLDLITIIDDAERNSVGMERAWEFMRMDPLRGPELMLRKLGHLWGLEDRVFGYFYSNGLLGTWPPWFVILIFLLLTLPLVFVLPMAAIGWINDRRTPQWWTITLLLIWYVGVHMLIMAEERFHLPLVPMMAALAARGLTRWPELREGLRRKETRTRVTVALIGITVLLAMANWAFELSTNADQLAILFGPEGSQAYFNY